MDRPAVRADYRGRVESMHERLNAANRSRIDSIPASCVAWRRPSTPDPRLCGSVTLWQNFLLCVLCVLCVECPSLIGR